MVLSPTFVLVRPEFEGNIGSVARVMKNFGFTDLRLVNPNQNHRGAEARMMACDAADVLKNAKLFSSLEEAVEDANIVLATSSGRYRSRDLDDLQDALPKLDLCLENNKLAVVLGNERNGLLDNELAVCSMKVRIESSEIYPALNLASAAGILAYQISLCMGKEHKQSQEVPKETLLPQPGEVDEFFVLMDQVLGLANFSRAYNKEKISLELRQVYQRMNPTKRENNLMKAALLKISKSLTDHAQVEDKRRNRL